MDKFNVSESVDATRLEKLFLENGILKVLRRNEYMVRQNDKTNHIGFVISGIFRLTRIDTNGNEWIIGYSFENDFVYDYPSLINRTGATVSIQATTDCEVYLLPLSEFSQFWETDMETQRSGRRITETMFAEIYQHLLGFYFDTPEQCYQSLMKRCPDLQERISLKEIAIILEELPSFNHDFIVPHGLVVQ